MLFLFGFRSESYMALSDGLLKIWPFRRETVNEVGRLHVASSTACRHHECSSGPKQTTYPCRTSFKMGVKDCAARGRTWRKASGASSTTSEDVVIMTTLAFRGNLAYDIHAETFYT